MKLSLRLLIQVSKKVCNLTKQEDCLEKPKLYTIDHPQLYVYNKMWTRNINRNKFNQSFEKFTSSIKITKKIPRQVSAKP